MKNVEKYYKYRLYIPLYFCVLPVAILNYAKIVFLCVISDMNYARAYKIYGDLLFFFSGRVK